MKNSLIILAVVGLASSVLTPADASVVISNLDPANVIFGFNAPEIGQSILTSNRPVSLTSVEVEQTGGLSSGESLAVYSRNTDGTVGSDLFSGFTLAFDSTTDVTTATVSGTFTLAANSGYYFVLSSNSTGNIEWSYTSSTDYASAFGATLPTADTSFDKIGSSTSYYSLADGPQELQVNGLALAAVPEPSSWALTGLALAGGLVWAARRRPAAR